MPGISARVEIYRNTEILNGWRNFNGIDITAEKGYSTGREICREKNNLFPFRGYNGLLIRSDTAPIIPAMLF
jgi:hypothetical protein